MKVSLQKLCLIWLCLVLGQSLLGAGYALAQEPPERPPLPPIGGDTGGGSSGGGDQNGSHQDEGLPQPAGASVSGDVYDYSGRVWAGGVTVVIDGGGWQTETVTDSTGHYRVDGLGSGPAVVELRLPPGVHPVSTGWPIILAQGVNRHVDLGYYWGDSSPLAVQLSGQLNSNVLALQVNNQTDTAVTGAQLQVILPGVIRSAPTVQGQGSVAVYDPHELQIKVDQIPAGEQAEIQATLSPVEGLAHSQLAKATDIRAILTFDQQITPQVLTFAPQSVFQAAAPPAATAQDSPAEPPPAADAFQAPAAGQSGGAKQPAGLEPLPTTGGSRAGRPGLAGAGLPLLLALGLTGAGLRSLKRSR